MGSQTSLVLDGVTAQYTHTLTVTERLGGLYTCTVDNEVSTQDSESFTVEGIYRSYGSLLYGYCVLLSLQLLQLPLT